MKNIDHFPKCIKKTVRYIKQDASQEQLSEIKEIIEKAIRLKNQNYKLTK